MALVIFGENINLRSCLSRLLKKENQKEEKKEKKENK
jgi:hypothetical protein